MDSVLFANGVAEVNFNQAVRLVGGLELETNVWLSLAGYLEKEYNRAKWVNFFY